MMIFRALIAAHTIFLLGLHATAAALRGARCRATPDVLDWPSEDDWNSFNASIDGSLVKAIPIASSCWPGNPFGSKVICDVVQANWSSATFHAELPESIQYQAYANNSCLPPGAVGYEASKGCELGGLPQYVADSKTEQHIAKALKWASARNIRIVVKGTGHELYGRSSGAYALSIWTHNFNSIRFDAHWVMPDGEVALEGVLIVGSGNVWRDVYAAAERHGRVVMGGGDGTVGLGGHIQGGGGHGPLSSTYGLAAHQVLQATIVTVDGRVRVANDYQHADLFWAIRGGGAGSYGVVTEYVLKTHPLPEFVKIGSLQIVAKSTAGANSSWNAAAVLVSSVPDLMDAGLTGVATVATGATSAAVFHDLTAPLPGVGVRFLIYGFNVTSDAMTSLIKPILDRIALQANASSLNVTWTPPATRQSFASFFASTSGLGKGAGGEGLTASRLLGRNEVSNIETSKLNSFLRRALHSRNEATGSVGVICLFGLGSTRVPDARWGSVHPAWRSAYIHFITTGALVNSTASGSPRAALREASEWVKENTEALFQEWAPGTGAYINEANPFNSRWKRDLYGEHYDRLLSIKRKYDPGANLFVLSGVGSDEWKYDLDSGKLCQTTT